MVMSNTTVINIKTDKELKEQVKEVARELGLPLGTIINAYLRELARERRVVFSVPPSVNKRTKKLLEAIESDIRAGKNADGPFTYKQALAYLDRL